MLTVLLTAVASTPVGLQASAEALWTDARPGLVTKLYGDVGSVRVGVMANRGQVPHTTRLDGFIGRSGSPASWIRVTGGVQIGMLIPDPPCRYGCADWSEVDARNEKPVGYGRLTLAIASYPSPSSTIEVLWQTETFPRYVGYFDDELLLAHPFLLFLVWPTQKSSLFFEQALWRRGPSRLGVVLEVRAPLSVIDDLLHWDTYGQHRNAFGPRLGGGLTLGAGPVTGELSGGITRDLTPYATLGLRFGQRRENTLW